MTVCNMSPFCGTDTAVLLLCIARALSTCKNKEVQSGHFWLVTMQGRAPKGGEDCEYFAVQKAGNSHLSGSCMIALGLGLI